MKKLFMKSVCSNAIHNNIGTNQKKKKPNFGEETTKKVMTY